MLLQRGQKLHLLLTVQEKKCLYAGVLTRGVSPDSELPFLTRNNRLPSTCISVSMGPGASIAARAELFTSR